jgi:hypothetical protein
MKNSIWKIDNKTASCMLDENHTLHITRRDYGICLKVKSNDDKRNTFYIRRIQNDQLGYTLTKRKYE